MLLFYGYQYLFLQICSTFYFCLSLAKILTSYSLSIVLDPVLGFSGFGQVWVLMAAHRVARRVNKMCGNHSPGRAGGGRGSGQGVQRRLQARVTVKYNRRELQRRLDVESWIDRGLDELYLGREDEMPEEVNIDELLDLKTDEERTQRLQIFICELLLKVDGLQKQEDLHNDGIDLPQLHVSPARSGSADREVLH
ncbi:protein phosphatase 1 regulatory subunit 14A-like isoform X2 [Cottoperca gobio]|uniref:Protein phosphatase 1 regulatory subunit 14A-like isoform X2 n=1 Tax=Cottoperca gobio TaxID=56716 RepID=A0A6J2PBD1_COTGO|nr:protein phosphatase 1 regulatory subunit 14A-like isoform X2 [Cottoperca gobio]